MKLNKLNTFKGPKNRSKLKKCGELPISRVPFGERFTSKINVSKFWHLPDCCTPPASPFVRGTTGGGQHDSTKGGTQFAGHQAHCPFLPGAEVHSWTHQSLDSKWELFRGREVIVRCFSNAEDLKNQKKHNMFSAPGRCEVHMFCTVSTSLPFTRG